MNETLDSRQPTLSTSAVPPLLEKSDKQVPISPGARAVPSHRQWLMFFTVVAGAFIAMLDTFIVNVAIPSISRGLQASFGEVELVIASYTLVYAVLLITGGRLGDIAGRKRMFLLGMTGFIITSACCGLAPSIFWLILSRVLQGASAAMMYPQALSILQTTFTGRERIIALSIYGSAIPFAAIAGQVGGGLLLQANILGLSWRPLFLINVPLGIVTLAAAVILLERRPTTTHTRLDAGGVGLVTTALLLLTVPLVVGREAGWPWWMLLMLAASFPAFLLFALFEQRLTKRGGAPLVNLALFRQRAFTVGNLIALAFFGCNAGMGIVLTVSLQIGLGFSPLHYGLTYACMAISTFVATTLLSRLTPRFGQYLVSLGSFTQAIGLFVMLALVLYAWARNNVFLVSSWTLTPIFLILGFGAGLGIAPLVGAIISRVRSQDAGTASGVLTTVMQTSNALGVAVVGLYFFTALGLLPGNGPQPIRYLLALGWTLPFLAALALVSGGLVWLLPAQKQEITS
ncbi:MAG TPA: MFS transporter [Ktedonobacteraceae bacterium]